MKRSFYYSFIFLFVLIWSCRNANETSLYNIEKSVVADSAMVVAAHPLAAQAGIDIIKQGGNAIDAAIAVQFALAVVYPRAGNIGGGGFMVIRAEDGSTDALDYREKAPLAAHRDMYLDSLGNVIPDISRAGHLAAGVPGTVAGMLAAYEKHGQIDEFKKLVLPAVNLAKEGFALTGTEANRLNSSKAYFQKYNENPAPFVQKEDWKEGDLFVQTDLGNTLSLIAEKGKAGFYAGETADKIVAEMQRGGGLISHEDLLKYDAKWREPVIGNYKEYKIITMPPPSSGGIALMQLLEIVEEYPMSEWGFHSPEAIHLMVESMRRVYADRAKHLGDNDFYHVPQDSLLNLDYLHSRMADYSPELASTSEVIEAGAFIVPESYETTHTSVIDQNGNAVSVTTTLNLNYGSKVIVQGAGFILNDEMDDFSAKPGIPNYFGLIGAEANAIEPEKRMLSSMTPTIAEKDGELFMVLGTPGGSTIITAVFQVFLNVTEFGMDLEDAVNAGRIHHQWLPDTIRYEKNALDSLTINALNDKDHKLKSVKKIAIVKAIQVLPDGKLHGVGDIRHDDDHAAGY